jgi:hypothetical protein
MEKPNYTPISKPELEKSRLPLIAYAVTFGVPIFLGIASKITDSMSLESVFGLSIFISPIIGMILAIISLCMGKKRIGTEGAVASVILLVLVGCFIAFFVFLWVAFSRSGGM